MRTALDYLIFDYSEDEEGSASWDAMATVSSQRWPALKAEVLQVLDWAQQQFPQQRGALDEGASWDFDLTLRTSAGEDLHPVAQGTPFTMQHAALPAGEMLTLTLTLTGRSAFADALFHTYELE